MAVFALEDGHLIPARFIDLAGTQLAEKSIAAIRERVIDILDVPLFPIAWQSEMSAGEARESLIALDPSGQITTIEVLELLNNEELLSALARAGRHGEISRQGLARMYGPGARSFPSNWQTFLNTCEPHPAPGPRLFLIVLSIDAAVMPAVQALSGAGLNVSQASIHDGNQILVSLEEVKPHGSAFGWLGSATGGRTVLEASAEPVEAPSAAGAAEPPTMFEPIASQNVEAAVELDPPADPPLTARVPTSVSADSAPSAYSPEEPAAEPALPAAPVAVEDAPRQRRRSHRFLDSLRGQTPVPEGGAQADPATAIIEPGRLSPAPEPEPDPVPSPAPSPSPASSHHPYAPAPIRDQAGSQRPTTLYEQSLLARRRLEQRLWEGSAPRHSDDSPAPSFISESTAARTSSDAVEEAAEFQARSSSDRLLEIARRCRAPFVVVWHQRRRGIEFRAEVTGWGTLMLSNGAVFTDPTMAARAVSGLSDVDGWKVWKTTSGQMLGEL